MKKREQLTAQIAGAEQAITEMKAQLDQLDDPQFLEELQSYVGRSFRLTGFPIDPEFGQAIRVVHVFGVDKEQGLLKIILVAYLEGSSDWVQIDFNNNFIPNKYNGENGEKGKEEITGTWFRKYYREATNRLQASLCNILGDPDSDDQPELRVYRQEMKNN